MPCKCNVIKKLVLVFARFTALPSPLLSVEEEVLQRFIEKLLAIVVAMKRDDEDVCG
jgi:hypothetical protein